MLLLLLLGATIVGWLWNAQPNQSGVTEVTAEDSHLCWGLRGSTFCLGEASMQVRQDGNKLDNNHNIVNM